MSALLLVSLTEADGPHTMMLTGVTWLDDDWWIIEGISAASTVTIVVYVPVGKNRDTQQ